MRPETRPWLPLALMVAACAGADRGPATCEAWSTPLRTSASVQPAITAVQPTPDGVAALWTDDEGLHLTDEHGEAIVADLQGLWLERLQWTQDGLVVSGFQPDWEAGSGTLAWATVREGVLDLQSLQAPAEATGGITTVRPDFVLHEALTQDMERSMLLQPTDGSSEVVAEWQPFPTTDGDGRVVRAFVLDTGLVIVGTLEVVDEVAQSFQVVRFDPTGEEQGRWTLPAPGSVYEVVPGRDDTLITVGDAGLQRVGAEGVLAEAPYTMSEHPRGTLSWLTILRDGDALWLIERVVPLLAEREEVWVRRFDADDLTELAPGPTLLWSSWGTRTAGSPYKLVDRTLALGLQRQVSPTPDGDYSSTQFRIDVAQMRCSGGLTPLDEVL